MQMKDDEGKPLIDEEVLDNIVGSIHVGNIATAYLSTWTPYFVAKDPKVLYKLFGCVTLPPNLFSFDAHPNAST